METEVKEAEVLDAVLEPRKLDESVPVRTPYEKEIRVAHENIAILEDGLYENSYGVLRDILDFRHLDPEDVDAQKAVLARWTEEMGDADAARQRWNLARSGWLKPADQPSGGKLAQELFVGITKAKSKQASGPSVTLNATFVSLPTPVSYPTIVEGSDD